MNTQRVREITRLLKDLRPRLDRLEAAANEDGEADDAAVELQGVVRALEQERRQLRLLGETEQQRSMT